LIYFNNIILNTNTFKYKTIMNLIDCFPFVLSLLSAGIIYMIECIKKRKNISNYIIFYDLETTGLNPYHSKIIEIAALLYSVEQKKVIDRFSSLVNPGIHIPEKITKITKIDDEMVNNAPNLDTVLKEFINFSRLNEECNIYFVAHNGDSFDKLFLRQHLFNNQYQINANINHLDTMRFAQKLLPNVKRYSLNSLCLHYGIEQKNAHRADADTTHMVNVYHKLCEELSSKYYSHLMKGEDESEIENKLVHCPTIIQDYIYN